MPQTKYTDLDHYYEILEEEPGATQERVKSAHRALVKILHPDQFLKRPTLLRKAEQKLKRVNDAYERLRLVNPDRRKSGSQAKPKDPNAKSGPKVTSTEEHQQESGQPKGQSRDGCLIHAIADCLRTGGPIDSELLVLMLQGIGLRCYETNRAKAIFEGMRENPNNYASRNIDCAKVRAYLLREWKR